MIFRNLTSSGDWTFGHGRQDYARDEQAIVLNIRTRLYSFLNDCFWSLQSGIDWWNLLGGKNPQSQVGIILQCRQTIANAEGVVTINTVDASVDVRTRGLVVSYNVDTLYTRNLRGSVVISP